MQAKEYKSVNERQVDLFHLYLSFETTSGLDPFMSVVSY